MTSHAIWMRIFGEQDVWEGLSPREYDVLYTLAKNARSATTTGPMRLNDLSRSVLLSQPALSRMVERLVTRGLVSRCADPADARASHLSLTPQGEALQRSVGKSHGTAVAQAMSGALSDDEIATLEALHLKLITHAQEEK